MVHNGVNLDRFRPSDPMGESRTPTLLPSSANSSPKKVFDLSSGRLGSWPKIRVFPTSVCGSPGGGGRRRNCRAYCQEHNLDRVEFLGQVADVQRLYCEATVVVVPSEWEEAFGLVTLEGMACGACVLASDVGGIPFVVGQNEDGGNAVSQGRRVGPLVGGQTSEHSDLPETVERYRRLRQRAERLFSLRHMVDNFTREFFEMIGEPRNPLLNDGIFYSIRRVVKLIRGVFRMERKFPVTPVSMSPA